MKRVNSKKIYNSRGMFISIFVAALLGLVVTPIHANNIQVGTPTLTGQNTTDDYVYVQFDLSWDNSWRTSSAPNNWDAAWVFVKYKPTGGNWAHATLNTSGHSVTTDNGVAATITTPTDGKGVFLYRTIDGTGSINWDGVKLRWNYGTDGLGDAATVTVKVFAIEMVYVPQGNFYVGDGSSTSRFHDGDNNAESFQVTSSQISFGQTDGNLWATGSWDSPSGSLQTDYPTGYTAFYCMKYEISQGQYADFLNTLTTTQDSTRYYSGSGYRYTIGGSAGSRSASVPDRACNYLSWMDGAAYSDWAGLRPMTELEFEKACRGPNNAVAGEYAWGNANIASTAYTLSNDGQPNATVTNAASDPTGNASYSTTDGSINGPLRCGIFATGSSTRAEAGASYYGVMELSGNLWERPVTLGNSDGRSFLGSHGDGSLSANGHATNSDWPGESGGEVTGATGAGFRGGHWADAATGLRVSDRSDAADTVSGRYDTGGSRCVRSAP